MLLMVNHLIRFVYCYTLWIESYPLTGSTHLRSRASVWQAGFRGYLFLSRSPEESD